MHDLITAIKSGADTPLAGIQFEKTENSNLGVLFFTSDTVYKVYALSNDYFIDFSTPEKFKRFITYDALWNTTLSPAVYTNIIWLRYESNNWVQSEEKDADNAVFIMRRIQEPNLTTLLSQKDVTHDQLSLLVDDLCQGSQKVAGKLREKKYPIIQQQWQELMIEFLKQAEPWAQSAAPDIKLEWSTATVSSLTKRIEASEYFKSFKPLDNVAAFDCHSDNVFIVDEKPVFLDSMLPREAWTIADPFANVAKIGADIEAHMGTKTQNILFDRYSAHNSLPPQEAIDTYRATYAFLKAIYVTLLGPKDMTVKYQNIVDEVLS